MKKRIRQNWCNWIPLILGLACGGLATQSAAQDARFRGASISWAPTSNPDEVVFHISYAARLSGSGAVLGATLSTSDFLSLDAVNNPGFAHRLSVTVTAVDVANDWFTGTNNFVWSYATYGPAGAGPFPAGIFSSCPLNTTGGVRISNIVNRSGGPYIVQTQVTPLGTNRSPVSPLGPLVYVPESAHSTFLVPATDPDGDPIRWRVATDAEAGGGSSPPNFTINPTNGLVTWNCLGLGDTNYTAQVIIEDLDATGNVKTQNPVDFILQIVPNTAPTCQVTPTNVITVSLGSSASFQVAGLNADLGDNVTLTASGLPVGAVLTPALPLTNPTNANTTFFWIPKFSDLGLHVVTFTATDSTGLTTSTNVTLNLIVNPDQATFVTLPAPAQVESVSPAGTQVPLTAQVTNTLGAPLTVQWTVDGILVHQDFVAGSTPVTAASLTFTGSYNLGQHTITVTAFDGVTPPATATTFVTIVDTTPPIISSCPPSQTVLLDSVSHSLTLPDLTGQIVASDNSTPVSGLTISQSPPAGTVLNRAQVLVIAFTVTDASGNRSGCATTWTVGDDTIPQVFPSILVSTLWPPNHDLQCVGFSYAVNKPDATVTIRVFSNEPDVPGSGGNALGGDDLFSPDATNLVRGAVVLRSERVGNGSGRVYLVTATAVDLLGQVGNACSTVVVAKSQSAADVASVNDQAAAAQAYFNTYGVPPAGYVQVGGPGTPVIGPKQTFAPCPVPPE